MLTAYIHLDTAIIAGASRILDIHLVVLGLLHIVVSDCRE